MELKLADRIIHTEHKAFVMGIVNCTPDSFFEKSRGGEEIAKKLIEEGADIIDIGGESTRPGSQYISEEEEISRVLPVIEAIRKYSNIPISVDTRKKSVMEKAWSSGADILNDVSALCDDETLADFCAQKKIPVILMHKRGIPLTMQKDTSYDDIFSETEKFLSERINYALEHGIEEEKIILDPGIGFGKDDEGNITLIAKCGDLCGGKYPVLMALSRKTCIGNITGKKVEDRLPGTLSANLLSVIAGAKIIRVHDVSAAVDSLKVLDALSSYKTFSAKEVS